MLFNLMLIVVSLSLFADLVAATESSTSEPTGNICQQFPSLTACQPSNEQREHKRFTQYENLQDPKEFNENVYENLKKRKSAYMRFGKRFTPLEHETGFSPEMAKRKSAYMRLGKRKSAYMRFGKKSDPDFDNKLYNDYYNEVQKRKSAYMRFGKRSLLADSNNYNNYNDMFEMEKRKSAYMRFGRR